MRKILAAVVVTLFFALSALAQESAPQSEAAQPPSESTYITAKPPLNTTDGMVTPPVVDPKNAVTLKQGTKILLTLMSPIITKNAKPGDPVYTKTSFPVVSNNRVIIPEGTFVQGVIVESQRAGRVKGRATMQLRFTTLIYPNGYALMLPGTLDNMPGDGTNKVKHSEGRVEAPGQVGKDATTVLTTTETGAGVGGLIGLASGHDALNGVGIGAASGLAIGIAEVLFTRGPDLKLPIGTSIEMVLERDLVVDLKMARARAE